MFRFAWSNRPEGRVVRGISIRSVNTVLSGTTLSLRFADDFGNMVDLDLLDGFLELYRNYRTQTFASARSFPVGTHTIIGILCVWGLKAHVYVAL